MADDRHPESADQPGEDDQPGAGTGAGDQTGAGKPEVPEPKPPTTPLGGYRPGGGSAGAQSGPAGFGSGFGGSGFGDIGSGGSGSTGSNNPPDNPLEALMASLAGGDTNALMAQLQSAFAMLGGPGGMFGGGPAAPGSGVNWDVAKDTARKTAASLGPDPTPDAAQRRAIDEASSIAEVWLDAATSLPRASTGALAWSRAEWIENTMGVWQRLVEPVAAHIADAMEGALSPGDGDDTQAIPGMAGMEQMLRPMLRTSGASMFGLQMGQALGRLSTEVIGATDIGLPLSEPGHVALLPTNIAAFGAGLEQSSTDITLYLALREGARQRLFAAAGWLREQVLTLVEQYAAGITIDTSALEQAVGQLDPTNMQDLAATLEGGLFEPQKTPEQLATLERLETMLALVEGWVDDVVTQASAPWMPAAGALAEVVRRSRASGGPAEATFATLVGLELRPRRMRDAANLWAAVRDARGSEGRDAVWSHPDLIPTSADLDDPLGFVSEEAVEAGDDEFDTALAELLDQAEAAPKPEDPENEPEDPENEPGSPDEPGPDQRS